MPGGKATRPGDVLTGASGKTVEVINTDAEGRLILGDALWYARKLGATHLVDVATLTGACMVALGRTVSGLFGAAATSGSTTRRERRRSARAIACGTCRSTRKRREQLRSEIADMVNSAGRSGGAVTAAAFLREFAGDAPWAHLDIAGPAWAETKEPYQPKGPTGVAVRAAHRACDDSRRDESGISGLTDGSRSASGGWRRCQIISSEREAGAEHERGDDQRARQAHRAQDHVDERRLVDRCRNRHDDERLRVLQRQEHREGLASVYRSSRPWTRRSSPSSARPDTS